MGKRSLSESKGEEAADAIGAPTTEKGEYEALCQLVNPIASPMANRKLAKKVYKLIKQASKDKVSERRSVCLVTAHFTLLFQRQLRQGIADVQKAIRKKEQGLVILAGLNVAVGDCRDVLHCR